LWSF
jgi:hypothetical protein